MADFNSASLNVWVRYLLLPYTIRQSARSLVSILVLLQPAPPSRATSRAAGEPIAHQGPRTALSPPNWLAGLDCTQIIDLAAL